MPTVELFFGFLRTCGLDHEWSAESAIREIYHCSRWERWVSVGCWVLSVCGLCPSWHLNQEPRQSRNERGELEGFPLDDTVPDHASLSRKIFRSPLHRNGSTGSLISTKRFLVFELSGFMFHFPKPNSDNGRSANPIFAIPKRKEPAHRTACDATGSRSKVGSAVEEIGMVEQHP
ncbi:hypothetical protein SCOR_31225 [Sulfidibacter corallicola]